MAKTFKKPHLLVNDFSASLEYKYPKALGGGNFKIKERERKAHGRKILDKLTKLNAAFPSEFEEEEIEDLIKDDVVFVQFFSEWGHELLFDQLHDKSKLRYQILNIKKEIHPDNHEIERYSALVSLTKGGVSHFIKKVNDYIGKDTKTGKPVANKLVANIEDIKIATLQAFWTDFQHYDFPERNQDVWWEIWIKKSVDNETKLLNQLELFDIQVGESRLEFEEHIIRLIKGTSLQLSSSLLLLDSLMEIRRPQEMNDFITASSVSYSDQQEWMHDLINRTDINIDSSSVLICLLDTGINNGHPLINKIIPENHLYTYNSSWGISDTEPNGGHGTAMSSLALYGDLTEALSTPHRVKIYHSIESFKIKAPNNSKIDKTLFGSMYEQGCTTPIIDRPRNPRIYCLTVTNDGFAFYGRPSAHSAALDAIAFGKLLAPELIFVSGGTLMYNKESEYPNRNYLESVRDPAQAYNVITVGSYTTKDKFPSSLFDTPIAPFGGMSPNNSTSATWETQWPNKPDIVLEGGNLASDGTNLWQRDELKPLAIDNSFPSHLFLPFDGTCSATAFATKMAAEIKRQYPKFWPETIRGLIIHSADWTKAMLAGRNLNKESDRRAIVRSVGYGVPNLEKALSSANNSLTLISESHLTPYKFENSRISYNEYHLYKLPWPKDVLRDVIAEKDVKIIVTLSYFIEPNPGQRQYANNFSYHSHDLDFKLIKPTETLKEFKRRISSASKKEDEEKPDLKGEKWSIRERVRSKGSIKKDYLNTNGVELSERNCLAIYPKSGWYRSRKALKKYDSKVRYSLIVSIESTDTNIDIYTPVEVQIKAPITVNLS